MSDAITLIHEGLTAVTTVVMAFFGWIKWREKVIREEERAAEVCQIDFQVLKTQVAVLDERVKNEIHLLEKLEAKLYELEKVL